MIQRSDMRMDPTLMRLTASYGAVAALQQSSLYLGKLIVQSAVNGISTAAISAFTATTRVENFSQAFGISGCEAIAILWPRTRGQKNTAGLWTASGTELSWWWGSAWYSLSC